MSDFWQQGLISTLQQLSGSDDAALECELDELARDRPISLVLPCHAGELARPALAHIIGEIAGAGWLREVIVSMNGIDEAGLDHARELFARLPQPHRILWNDSPAMLACLDKMAAAGAGDFPQGKGLNLWAGTAVVCAEGQARIVVTHDCDVSSYRRALLARLAFPLAHPECDYAFAKMYYSRVTDRLYGRVSRLFLQPLLQAFLRVLGHQPLIDFLLSFRYPLAGEYAFDVRVAGELPMRPDWGLEVGLLCDIFRHIEPRRVCQVDGGSHYDHKHQPLGTLEAGLLRMSADIGRAIFEQLRREGVTVDPDLVDAVSRQFDREAAEALRRYRNLALMNRIPFDEAEEHETIGKFSEALAGWDATVQAQLPPWRSFAATHPDLAGEFLATATRHIFEGGSRLAFL